MTIDPATVSAANAYKILIGSIVPRPIGFISTISSGGVFNLAPFSFFNGVCGDPPVVCFAPNARTPRKDTLMNIQATGEFVVNIVSEEIAEQMNLCSGNYPPEVDEFQVSGLTPIPSDIIRPPRVLESHVNMECRAMQVIEVSGKPLGGHLVLGEVVRFHVDDAIIDSRYHIDAAKLRAIGRMGGMAYCRTRDRFEMVRPP